MIKWTNATQGFRVKVIGSESRPSTSTNHRDGEGNVRDDVISGPKERPIWRQGLFGAP